MPLRPATAADFPFVRQVAGRPENARFIVDDDEAALQALCDADDCELLIWERDGAPAGFALFCELDNPAKRAELRRLALAKTDGGIGRQFLGDLVDHAFSTLGVDRVWLDVAVDNPRAQATYRRAGFTHEGRLRNHWRRPAGDVVSLDVYAMLRSEWPG